MKALRVPTESLSIGEHRLDPDAAHYVSRVHRLQPGAELVLFDVQTGQEASARLVSVTAKAAVCRVERIWATTALPEHAISLYQSLAKGDKNDRVIRDATALGVSRILLVATERSVTRYDNDTGEARLGRWQRIAVESARQCGRGNLPELTGPIAFDAAAELQAETQLKLLLSPLATQTLSGVLRRSRPQPVALFIGPEGGLAPTEEQALIARGFQPVRFGRFTLRTETAATAVLGALVDWGLEGV